MQDSTGLGQSLIVSTAGYPLYLARTLMQLGYEPTRPDHNGYLPNLFSYIKIISKERGYLYLYTGLGYHLTGVVLKKVVYDGMSGFSNKKKLQPVNSSEVIAVCIRESVIKIYCSLITYPLVTMGIGYISSVFFGADDAMEYTVNNLYSGIIPKILIEVTMVCATVISRSITRELVHDETAQEIVSRVPPFIIQSLLYPLNVVSTVMADGGRSRLNPTFSDWRSCYRHLQRERLLKRGSAFILRRIPPRNYGLASIN